MSQTQSCFMNTTNKIIDKNRGIAFFQYYLLAKNIPVFSMKLECHDSFETAVASYRIKFLFGVFSSFTFIFKMCEYSA